MVSETENPLFVSFQRTEKLEETLGREAGALKVAWRETCK